MNNGNLKRLSPEEAREQGSKGGKRSVEVRREKRLMRETLQKKMLGMYILPDTKQKATGYNAVTDALILRALKGDVSAYLAIRDTLGEKPTEKLDVGSSEVTGINIKFVNKSHKSGDRSKDPKIVGDYTPPTNADN